MFLTRWDDYDRSFTMMNELRRRMDRMFGELEGRGAPATAGFPRSAMWDNGSSLTVLVEAPGLSEKDYRLTLNQSVLTIEGERRVDAPQGFSVHRQERSPVRFARSFNLPARVDVEKVTAVARDGVLTVTLPKAPEAQPRQITVKGE